MSNLPGHVAFSFRARLVIIMAVLLIGSFAMVQYLNQSSQREVHAALDLQKLNIDNTFFEHVTDITQAQNFALMSFGQNQYIFDILKRPEFEHAINRERIRHILVLDENGMITDSSERGLKDKVIAVPKIEPGGPLGRVVRGDPVADLIPGDQDDVDSDNPPDTYWTFIETTTKGGTESEATWIAIVASNREVTGTLDKSQTRVADTVEATASMQSQLTLGIFALAIALTILLVWRFTRPVRTLSEAAERVTQGELDFTVNIPRRDEMGQLAQTFNAMIGGLKAKSELEERLNNAERAAVIGRLTSAIAHEIRNPLNFINLSIDHVRSKYPPADPVDAERFARLLTSIKEETARLNRLVTDVLNFGRPAHLNVRTTDLREVMESVLAIVRTQADEQGVVLTTDIPPAPAEIEGDAEKLKSCFSNIVINAIQAMPNGGHLDVEIRDEPGGLVVSIHDTGVGIPEGALDRVFEPYYSTKDTGTGLGLAVTKKIVEEHGGRIRVRSEPGAGTTFEVNLPRERASSSGRERLSVAGTKP